MTILLLNEHVRSEPIRLSPAQQAGLVNWFGVDIEHTADGGVRVVPGSRVGAVRFDGLDVVVRPKLPISRLLSMIAETSDPYRWSELDVSGLSVSSLHDGVAALFARSCLRAFDRGILQSYRREDQSLAYVRGRLRFEKYVRSPMPLPVPVTTGVFDSDNAENQVLRAALNRVRSSPSFSETTRLAAQHAWRSVAHVKNLRDPLAAIESISWTRQNQYYRGAVSLARLILASGTGGELRDRGEGSDIPGFTVSLPHVVEDWVRTVLRRHWGASHIEFPDSWKGRVWLDEARQVQLNPDLGVKVRDEWRFVGDVKYKDLSKGGVRPEDVYQMVSYLTATGMKSGTLVYAGVGAADVTLDIAHSGGTLRVVSIDLSQEHPADELVEKIGKVHPGHGGFSLERERAGVVGRTVSRDQPHGQL